MHVSNALSAAVIGVAVLGPWPASALAMQACRTLEQAGSSQYVRHTWLPLSAGEGQRQWISTQRDIGPVLSSSLFGPGRDLLVYDARLGHCLVVADPIDPCRTR